MSDQDPAADREGMPPSISQLIRDYQARTGESLHRASERSARTGSTVAQSYLSNLKNGKAPGWPKNPETYLSLAVALETTPLAIVLGFAVERGVPVRVPVLASQLPLSIDEAPAPQRDALVAMAWAIAHPEVGVRRFEDPEWVDNAPGVEDDRRGRGEAGTSEA